MRARPRSSTRVRAGTLIQYFKDDATAFNAQKRGTISGKGVINNRISEHIFTALQVIGVPTHFIRRLNMREQLIRQVEIIPIEVVIRNVAAGSLSKRLGIEEGTQLPRTIIEYYYKDDALGDPMIADEHIACFGWATQDEMNDIADMAIRVNDFLSGMFAAIGIRLIDFKLEFGGCGTAITPASSSPTRSARTAAGCGTSRRTRNSTRTASVRSRWRRGSLSGSRAPARTASAGRRDGDPGLRLPPARSAASSGNCLRQASVDLYGISEAGRSLIVAVVMKVSALHRRSWKRTFLELKSSETRRKFSRMSVPSNRAGSFERPKTWNGGKSAKAIGTL